MGVLTLKDFRDELTAVMQARGAVDDPRKNRWINFGLLDVTGAVEFEELNEEIPLNVPVGAVGVAVPTSTRGVKSVITSAGPLDWVDEIEYYRIRGSSGASERWTRIGQNIRLAPNPIAVTPITALLKVEPNILAGDADKTSIPSTWDQAIHYLACSHAFYAVGEDQRAVTWLNRAIAYIQTRANEELRRLVEPGIGGTMRFIQERAAILSEGA